MLHGQRARGGIDWKRPAAEAVQTHIIRGQIAFVSVHTPTASESFPQNGRRAQKRWEDLRSRQ